MLNVYLFCDPCSFFYLFPLCSLVSPMCPDDPLRLTPVPCQPVLEIEEAET